MTNTALLLQELKKVAKSDRARASVWYFKAGKGQYGEGDRFLGVTVPDQRSIAKKYAGLFNPSNLSQVLQSPYHEMRATGLFILIQQFNRAPTDLARKKWVNCYLAHLTFVNNWDLVDSSAPAILGPWLLHRNRDLIYRLARSKDLWKNRIAILTTLAFIRENDFDDLLQLAVLFLSHPHDLMHKATGWMLREAWKRNPYLIEDFLNQNAAGMPRTMLRYAIEKMPSSVRKKFLSIKKS